MSNSASFRMKKLLQRTHGLRFETLNSPKFVKKNFKIFFFLIKYIVLLQRLE